jgi:hypothetical protein
MGRWMIVVTLFVLAGSLRAQEMPDSTACRSPWRLEYQMMVGSVKVLDIEDIPQPKIGAASQGGGFMFGLEYRLGEDWSLYAGVHAVSRQGLAMADGIPFELLESGLDIPLLLRTDSWSPFGGLLPPAVSFVVGVGPYYGMVFGMKAYELPGVTQRLAVGADAGAFGYHHLGILAELRIRLRPNERDDVTVGIHTAQDLLTFGASDSQPIVPRFNMIGIAIGYSRPAF